MPDLVERLADSARDAVLNERPSLEADPARLRGLVVDLKLDGRGQIVDGTAYVELKGRPHRGGRG